MTETEAYDLGERALRAGFKWRPGCVAVSSRKKYGPAVYLCPDYDSKPMFCCLTTGAEPAAYDCMAPDFRDCGVIAHALAQTRERAGMSFCLRRGDGRGAWEVKSDDMASELVPGCVGTYDDNPGVAVVLALELTHRGGF